VKWLEGLEYPVKLVIAGNHDSLLDPSLPSHSHYRSSASGAVAHSRSLLTSPSALARGIRYLEYSSTSFTIRPGGRRWSVWGSPGSPSYGSPAFQYSYEESEAVYARMPDQVDILITHTPPQDRQWTLDRTSQGFHAGCPALARRLAGMGAGGPWMHVFGHIHEGWGWEVAQPEEVERRGMELLKESERGQGRRRRDGRKGGRGRKTDQTELAKEMEDLTLRDPSTPTNSGAGPALHSPRWRLSVNAALGRMGPNGTTSKGVRGPIVVDFWEERMDRVNLESDSGDADAGRGERDDREGHGGLEGTTLHSHSPSLTPTRTQENGASDSRGPEETVRHKAQKNGFVRDVVRRPELQRRAES